MFSGSYDVCGAAALLGPQRRHHRQLTRIILATDLVRARLLIIRIINGVSRRVDRLHFGCAYLKAAKKNPTKVTKKESY